MITRYPALYRDAHGEEATVIENDGKTLRMVVRGVEFTGTMFDDFEPSIAQDDPDLAPFSLYCGSLCSCINRMRYTAASCLWRRSAGRTAPCAFRAWRPKAG